MDIQKTIQHLFAKAASTHSEHEAEAAILKAHELMAKYGITDVTSKEDIKYATESCKHSGNRSFRRYLAGMIAPNFRVKYFLRNMEVTFFGRESDVRIAKEVFEYAYRFANRKSQRICREMRANQVDTSGIINSYTFGFCKGLKEQLDAQSTALLVITPQDVDQKYTELSQNFKKSKRQMKISQFSNTFYEQGRQDGRSVLNRHRLEDKGDA